MKNSKIQGERLRKRDADSGLKKIMAGYDS